MKCGVLRTVLAAFLCCALFAPSFSQNYYLVVGAFSTESDDIKEFTSVLPNKNDTAYTVATANSLLHLYVLKTSNKETAIARSMKLRETMHDPQGLPLVMSQEAYAGAPGPEERSSPVLPVNNDVYATASSKVSGATAASGGAPPMPKSKSFKFTITSAEGNPLAGAVHHIDFDQQREVQSFTVEAPISLPWTTRVEPMTVVCGVFGYKEVEKYVDFANPSLTEGVYRDEQGTWVIPYELERLEKGDVSVMYNVSFYDNAVPMMPSSKSDLDELVSLMRLNPNYVIKVHGHCNGKKSRQITTISDGADIFDPNGVNQEKASAKELANLRAQAVKHYLLDNGIAENRIKTYSWGGTYMLVDENDPQQAKLNNRIEIEILQD